MVDSAPTEDPKVTGADEPTSPEADRPEWLSIRANDTNLRSSPDNETNYTAAVLQQGDRVLAMSGDDRGWMRIRLEGPRLSTVHGLLKADDRAIERRGDRVVVAGGSHAVKIPNVNARIEGGVRPLPLQLQLRHGPDR